MKQEDFIEAAENTSRLVLQQFVSIMSKTNYDVQQTCEKIDASIYKCLK
jgi:hypothetical protein